MRSRPRWRCRCDCGLNRVVAGDLLRTGKTKSCGCWHREVVSKLLPGQQHHGWRVLQAMTFRRRCRVCERELTARHGVYLCNADCRRRQKAIQRRLYRNRPRYAVARAATALEQRLSERTSGETP